MCLGGAGAAADDARAAHAQIQRAFDPMLRIGQWIIEAADGAFAGGQEHAREHGVCLEGVSEPVQLPQADFDVWHLEQQRAGAGVGQGFDQLVRVSFGGIVADQAAFDHGPGR
jgi:hypothetical protein